jgi:hypothetical protein
LARQRGARYSFATEAMHRRCPCGWPAKSCALRLRELACIRPWCEVLDVVPTWVARSDARILLAASETQSPTDDCRSATSDWTDFTPDR